MSTQFKKNSIITFMVITNENVGSLCYGKCCGNSKAAEAAEVLSRKSLTSYLLTVHLLASVIWGFISRRTLVDHSLSVMSLFCCVRSQKRHIKIEKGSEPLAENGTGLAADHSLGNEKENANEALIMAAETAIEPCPSKASNDTNNMCNGVLQNEDNNNQRQENGEKPDRLQTDQQDHMGEDLSKHQFEAALCVSQEPINLSTGDKVEEVQGGIVQKIGESSTNNQLDKIVSVFHEPNALLPEEKIVSNVMDQNANTTSEELKWYEEYISRLENIADIIEKQFENDSKVNEPMEMAVSGTNDLHAISNNNFRIVEFCTRSNTWVAEGINDESIFEINLQPEHSVKISNCHKSVFKINGKAVLAEIDGCSSCGFVADELDTVQISNCKKVEFQILNTMKTLYASDTDGLIVFLTDESSKKTHMFFKKCSEVNASCPSESGQVELPIPEQMRTYWDGKKWTSECYSHNF